MDRRPGIFATVTDLLVWLGTTAFVLGVGIVLFAAIYHVLTWLF